MSCVATSVLYSQQATSTFTLRRIYYDSRGVEYLKDIVDGLMRDSAIFRFNQATFDFGAGPPVEVRLVADQHSRKKHDTHFTLLMGANGTCKSRLLSCCVNFLKSIDEDSHTRPANKTRRSRPTFESDHEIRCMSAKLTRDGVLREVGDVSSTDMVASLPSRVLAIANLVRDRFTFVDWEEFDDPFYYYLGVRQASNLTTTGAMDRLVCDAVMALFNKEEEYASFSKWTAKLFRRCEKGLAFPKFSRKHIERFLKDPVEAIKRRYRTARMRSDTFYEQQLTEIQSHSTDIMTLADLIHSHGFSAEDSGSVAMQRNAAITLNVDQLSASVRRTLGKLSYALRLASRYHQIMRPSLVLHLHKWLDFTQLSSGEQNLLATGARLYAFTVPGSFVVIDEPEVSLNVAWQQRYIDLISQALTFARGSHVVIASHSPYLVSDLRSENSTVVVVDRSDSDLSFRSHAGKFWGWGSEAILYEVLGLTSASNFHFSRELSEILKLVRNNSQDRKAIESFLQKCDRLDFGKGAASLKAIVDEVRAYAKAIQE